MIQVFPSGDFVSQNPLHSVQSPFKGFYPAQAYSLSSFSPRPILAAVNGEEGSTSVWYSSAYVVLLEASTVLYQVLYFHGVKYIPCSKESSMQPPLHCARSMCSLASSSCPNCTCCVNNLDPPHPSPPSSQHREPPCCTHIPPRPCIHLQRGQSNCCIPRVQHEQPRPLPCHTHSTGTPVTTRWVTLPHLQQWGQEVEARRRQGSLRNPTTKAGAMAGSGGQWQLGVSLQAISCTWPVIWQPCSRSSTVAAGNGASILPGDRSSPPFRDWYMAGTCVSLLLSKIKVINSWVRQMHSEELQQFCKSFIINDCNILWAWVAISVTVLNISTSSLHFLFLAPADKILVHCAMGRSRSAALVLAYLMIYKNMTVVNAIEQVVKHRCVLPNRGFLKQLRELDIALALERTNSKNISQSNGEKNSPEI